MTVFPGKQPLGIVRRCLRYQLYRPVHVSTLVRDAFLQLNRKIPRKPATPATLRFHLDSAMRWLCHAHDANRDGGVSLSYSFAYGYRASYPETTGYLIPTFLRYARLTGDSGFNDRATAMADWLLSIQMETGSFQAGAIDQAPVPSVFNTGQILFGLMAMFDHTTDERYLDAAKKAASWLCSIISSDGIWKRFTYHSIPHTYYARVALALLEVFAATGDNNLKHTAERHFEWVLSRMEGDGWYSDSALEPGTYPLTHTIVYVIEGLLGGFSILGNEGYFNAAQSTVDSLVNHLFRFGTISGEHNISFSRRSGYQCLVGNAQLSGAILTSPRLAGRKKYMEAAVLLNRQLMAVQHHSSTEPGIHGGISGSFPVWGAYFPLSFPNWAAKFFADALMAHLAIHESMRNNHLV